MATATKNWTELLSESATLLSRSVNASKRAGALLWDGAKQGIEGWDTDKDPYAEALAADALDALGKARKGDVSKIKTVALAVRNEGLDLSNFENLSKAYAAARNLTQTVKAHKAEDDAAEEAVAVIATAAPKSTSTAEGAAQIVLAKGVDEAARLMLDALNTAKDAEGNPVQNLAAHRSLMRAIAQEITGRIPKPEPKPKREPKPKGAAKKAGVRKPVAKKAVAKKAAPVKAKPVAAKDATGGIVARAAKAAVARPKAKPVVKAKPVSAE
jgi:hypothetical protein